MKILADEEGIKVIQSLCDTALKQGGKSVMQGIVNILNSYKTIPEDKK